MPVTTTDTGRDKNWEIQSKNLLIVEGGEDLSFFSSLLATSEISDVHMISFNTNTAWDRKIASIKRANGFDKVRSIALVEDADSDFDAALQRCRSALQSNNFPVPGNVRDVARDSDYSSSIFISSESEGAAGSLEEMILARLTNSGQVKCAESFVECLAEQGITPKYPGKAKLRALAFAQPTFYYNIGDAFKRGFVDFSSSEFDDLRTWLNQVFGSNP